MPSLVDAIRQESTLTPLPKGGEGLTIGIDAIMNIAQSQGIDGYIVEAEALKNDIYPTRYIRNFDGLTPAQQITLLESSVAQVGLGGLGGSLLDILLRTGIGTIRGADGDIFEESNLNRQALSAPDNMDIPKADAASKRAAYVNPSINFTGKNDFLSPSTFPDFLHGVDLAIDALGGLKSRLALQHAASDAGIPMVTGALAGWTGYVGVVMPGNSGPADIMGSNNAAEEKLGCPAPAVTFFASVMANEVVKVLTGVGDTLDSAMLIVDLQNLSFERILL